MLGGWGRAVRDIWDARNPRVERVMNAHLLYGTDWAGGLEK